MEIPGHFLVEINTLQIDSEVGRGTRIRILLPATTGDERENEKEGEHQDAGKRTDIGTVLIVEDEEAVREVAVQLFEALGYEVMAVENGNEALAALSKQNFDVLFSDVVMPNGPNGVELAAQAKAMQPDIKTRIGLPHAGFKGPRAH
jgi:PleD family two-component response regulator